MTNDSKPKKNYPSHSLEKALVIIEGIVDKGGGKQMNRLLVADAIGRTPNSSEFKKLLSSSFKYGLTVGTEKAKDVTATSLGLKICKPTSDENCPQGLREACLKPELFAEFFKKYNGNKIPERTFLENILEKSYGVNSKHTSEAAKFIIENGKFCGIIQDISGSPYVNLDGPKPDIVHEEIEEKTQQELEETSVHDDQVDDSTKEDVLPSDSKPRQLFIAHGKNTKISSSLKKILDGFSIKYKVAVDEPNTGRPISKKVAELMNECSAGIFIFTKDELFFKENGQQNDQDKKMEEIWRPSENVVYELGAATVKWEKKIIILKEEGVYFPSNFSDLGYISFSGDTIDDKAMDLIKELVGLGLVKINVN